MILDSDTHDRPPAQDRDTSANPIPQVRTHELQIVWLAPMRKLGLSHRSPWV
jgi:hypothetical protein